MSDTGKQSPLGINVLGSVMQNIGFHMNPITQAFVGRSRTNGEYTFGSIVSNSCLRVLTWAINDGCLRGFVSPTVYNNLITIGQDSVPALGNAPPTTFANNDTTKNWGGQATTGYYLAGNIGQGQDATWIPYNKSNPNADVTQWGFIRCFALQAWNEYNWNGVPTENVNYRDFLSTLMTAKGYIDYTNVASVAAYNATTFLEGVYSNMNDLITGDVAGVSLSFNEFGQDCITAGRIIDLSQIDRFGLPSVLLQTLKKNNALTPSLTLALVSAGLDLEEIDAIALGIADSISTRQQKQIYGAFLVITGVDLETILISLNCKTRNIFSLAELLDIRKIFPTSYRTLTVPLYNTADLPTNSKTYYLIFSNDSVNSQITTNAVKSQVGTIIPLGMPAESISTMQTETSLQLLPEGFGSYLEGILPSSVAVTAGAFSYSMQQIKNIQYMDFEKFGQSIKSLETTRNLDNIGVGKVPVNLPLANTAINYLGFGSGPKGSLTMSDFFGCMSGLPYSWDDVNNAITTYQTDRLKTIYREMFLAVTWEPAVLDIKQVTGVDVIQTWKAPTANKNFNPKKPESPTNPSISDPGQPGIYAMWYRVVITVQNIGGGYGRGGAASPNVAITPNNCKAVVTTTIGTDDTNIGSMGKGKFGRVEFTINNGGKFVYSTVTVWGPPPNPFPPKETISVERPPTAMLPVASGPGQPEPRGQNLPGNPGSAGGTTTNNNPTSNPSPTPTPSGTREIILLNNQDNIITSTADPITITISNGVADDTVQVGLTAQPTAYTGPFTGATYTLSSSGTYTSAPITFDKPGNYDLEFNFTKSGNRLPSFVRYRVPGYNPKVTAPATVRTGESFNLTITDCPPGINGYWFFGSRPVDYTITNRFNFVLDSTGSISIPITLTQEFASWNIRVELAGVTEPSYSVNIVSEGASTLSEQANEVIQSTVVREVNERFSALALTVNNEGTVYVSGGKPNTAFTWRVTDSPYGSNGTMSGTGTFGNEGFGTIRFSFDTPGQYFYSATFDGSGSTKSAFVAVYEATYSWNITMSNNSPAVNESVVFTLSSTKPGTTVNWKVDVYPDGFSPSGGQFKTDANGSFSGPAAFNVAGYYKVSFTDANNYGGNYITFTVT